MHNAITSMVLDLSHIKCLWSTTSIGSKTSKVILLQGQCASKTSNVMEVLIKLLYYYHYITIVTKNMAIFLLSLICFTLAFF